MGRRFINYTLITLTAIFIIGSLFNVCWGYTLSYSHWSANTTYWYVPGSDISSEGIYSITLADNQWNGIANRKVELADTGERCLTKSYTKNGVNEIFKNNMGAGYLAETCKWYNALTHHAYEGDIVINTYYPISASTPPASGTYHLASLMSHEMGHICGLGDQSTVRAAVMYYGFSTNEVRYTLHSDDIDGYNHVSW